MHPVFLACEQELGNLLKCRRKQRSQSAPGRCARYNEPVLGDESQQARTGSGRSRLCCPEDFAVGACLHQLGKITGGCRRYTEGEIHFSGGPELHEASPHGCADCVWRGARFSVQGRGSLRTSLGGSTGGSGRPKRGCKSQTLCLDDAGNGDGGVSNVQ